jgi:hypothetical protein
LYFSGHISTIAVAVIVILYCFFLLQLSLPYKNINKIKVHPAIVLCSSCIPEKVGINQKTMNQKWYSHQTRGEVSITGRSQLKGIEPNIRECKFRTFVNWQGALNKKI